LLEAILSGNGNHSEVSRRNRVEPEIAETRSSTFGLMEE
jgi:hypothetical protein